MPPSSRSAHLQPGKGAMAEDFGAAGQCPFLTPSRSAHLQPGKGAMAEDLSAAGQCPFLTPGRVDLQLVRDSWL